MIFGRKKKQAKEAAQKAAKVAAQEAVVATPAVPAANPAPNPAPNPAAPAKAPPPIAVQTPPASAGTVPQPAVAVPPTAPAQPASAAAPSAPAPDAANETPVSRQENELRNRRALAAKMVAASFGEIVNIFMHSNAYKHHSLADLEWLVTPAILTQQFVLAEARKTEEDIPAPIAAVLWASVSPEVDERLMADTSGSLRLRPDEWKSGETLWLINAVGPGPVIGGLIDNLHKNVFKGLPLKVRARDDQGNPIVKIQKMPQGTA